MRAHRCAPPPFGTLAVEDFRVGDEILTRPEANAGCEVCVSVVEEIFVRESRLIRLRVQGRDILTSPEHPFWVDGRGWVATEDLNIGDGLSSHDGSWVAVEAIVDTGEVTTVYNLRVADHHTYFVGCDEWGFSVWAHNSYSPYYLFQDFRSTTDQTTAPWAIYEKGGNGHPFNDPHHGVISGSSRQEVINKLTESLIQGAKVYAKNVILNPFGADFGDWLSRVNVDILSQKQFSPHIPQWTTTSYEPHAHHIVMKKGRSTAYDFVRQTQSILQHITIDPIVGRENLVWAPNFTSHRSGTGASPQTLLDGYTGKGYAEAVYLRVAKAIQQYGNDRTEIQKELKSIAINFVQEIW